MLQTERDQALCSAVRVLAREFQVLAERLRRLEEMVQSRGPGSYQQGGRDDVDIRRRAV
jgi:hypothetical protein